MITGCRDRGSAVFADPEPMFSDAKKICAEGLTEGKRCDRIRHMDKQVCFDRGADNNEESI